MSLATFNLAKKNYLLVIEVRAVVAVVALTVGFVVAIPRKDKQSFSLRFSKYKRGYWNFFYLLEVLDKPVCLPKPVDNKLACHSVYY